MRCDDVGAQECDESVLVEVFEEFLRTNEFALRSVPDLLAFAKTMTVKHFGTYQHAGIPYRSTLYKYVQGKSENWLWIHLNTGAFIFQSLATQARIARQDDDRWVRMGKGKVAKYNEILSHFGATFSCKIYYNEYMKKVDIKLFSNNPESPCVFIVFEEGYPELDEGRDGAYPCIGLA